MTSRPAGSHPRHFRLARQIVAVAIADGWRPGRPVTEADLATRLAVSRSPVRAALKLLAKHGVLSVRSSRGYMLTLGAGRLSGFTLTAPQAPDERLHDALIRDRLGARIDANLSQANIARRYDIGLPTALRVLLRMEQEGLVVRNGSHWVFAPTLDGEQSRRASYDLRLMVEPAALLLGSFRMAPELLGQLRTEHEAMRARLELAGRDPTRLFDIDARFHEELARASGNPFVLAAVRQQNTLRRLLELASYRNRERTRQWLGEHLAILDALVDDDRGSAAALLRSHLEHAAHGAEATAVDVLTAGRRRPPQRTPAERPNRHPAGCRYKR